MVDKLNSQEFGERGKPANPDEYLRKAVIPEVPATEKGDTGSGLPSGTPSLDSMGRPKTAPGPGGAAKKATPNKKNRRTK